MMLSMDLVVKKAVCQRHTIRFQSYKWWTYSSTRWIRLLFCFRSLFQFFLSISVFDLLWAYNWMPTLEFFWRRGSGFKEFSKQTMTTFSSPSSVQEILYMFPHASLLHTSNTTSTRREFYKGQHRHLCYCIVSCKGKYRRRLLNRHHISVPISTRKKYVFSNI